MAKSVGARKLEIRLLGTYLRQAREGATIVVTDRRKPVAEPRAVPPAKTEEEAQLRELVATGLLAPLTGSQLPQRTKPIRIDGPSLSEAVIEDREACWATK